MRAIKAGATSQTINVFIQDSSSLVGAGLTGLAYNSGSLTAYYALPLAAAVAITLATLAAVTTAWASGGFKEIDATNMPGWYRLDLPNAAVASGTHVVVHLKGATNMAPLAVLIELTATDNQDAVRFGMTALPNAAAEAAGGIYTRGSGAGQINQAANGMVDANVVRNAGTAITAASGRQEVNATHWLGTAILAPGTAGTPDVNAKLIGGTAQTGRDLGLAGSPLRKNTAFTNFKFLMTDSTNHNPATGKTVTATRSVDNGAFGAGTLGSVTELSAGYYLIDLGAGDTNGKAITLRFTASGCDDNDIDIYPEI